MSDSGEQGPKPTAFTVMQTQDWVDRWGEGKTGFHKEYIHPMLERNLDKMIDGRENIRVFFPLCGKSWDMKWLADKGHSVVGVEAAQKAIEEFSAEQNVTFTSEPAPACNGTIYQSEDKRIKIYCCDLYNFSREVAGQFDGIWDRGSLVAINREDRVKYSEIIKSVMAPGCKYLVSTLIYDESKYAGPPHLVTEEQLKALYGDKCSVEQIDEMWALEERHKTSWGLDSLYERIYLIRPLTQ